MEKGINAECSSLFDFRTRIRISASSNARVCSEFTYHDACSELRARSLWQFTRYLLLECVVNSRGAACSTWARSRNQPALIRDFRRECSVLILRRLAANDNERLYCQSFVVLLITNYSSETTSQICNSQKSQSETIDRKEIRRIVNFQCNSTGCRQPIVIRTKISRAPFECSLSRQQQNNQRQSRCTITYRRRRQCWQWWLHHFYKIECRYLVWPTWEQRNRRLFPCHSYLDNSMNVNNERNFGVGVAVDNLAKPKRVNATKQTACRQPKPFIHRM